MPIRDLTGQRFGRLTVIKDSGERRKNRQVIWSCLCDCGHIHKAAGSNLLWGYVKSCGCYNRDTCTAKLPLVKKNISGMRFGRLTAMKPTKERKFGSVVWECACDCGEIAYKPVVLLYQGCSSCGCKIVSHCMARCSVLEPEDIPLPLVRLRMAISKVDKEANDSLSKE